MIATEHAECYDILPQNKDESDSSFRGRVAGALRDKGHIVEAHEAQQDKRYDAHDGEDVLSGVMGAVAMAMSDADYRTKSQSRVVDEIAAGHLAQQKKRKPDMSLAEIELLMLMLD